MINLETICQIKDRDFNNLYHEIYGKLPRNITFIVTESCNLRCSYCYEHNKQERVMSLDVAKKAIDMLFEEDARQTTYINKEEAPALIMDFIGGEPFLEVKLIDDIMTYFLQEAIRRKHRWATHYYINVSTNGTLCMTPEVQAFIRKWKQRLSVAITLDGDKEIHDKCRKFPNGDGSFDLALESFLDLSKKYWYNGTKITISPDNLPYLKNAILFMFEDLKLNYVHANCVFEEGWEKKHATELYYILKEIADWLLEDQKYKFFNLSLFNATSYSPMPKTDDQCFCGGTGKMLAIGVDGTIYPCLRYAPHCIGELKKPLVIGDVEHGIEYTKAEQDICKELRAITRSSCSTDECFNCPIAKGCGWCPGYCYEYFGTANKRSMFICDMHKAISLVNGYYWNKILRLEGEFEQHWPIYLGEDDAISIIGKQEYEMIKGL